MDPGHRAAQRIAADRAEVVLRVLRERGVALRSLGKASVAEVPPKGANGLFASPPARG